MKVFDAVRIAMAVLCVTTVTAFAEQEHKANPGAQADDEISRRDRPDSNSMSDDEIRELVSTIMMVRISRDLELNDEQTVLLVRHLQEMREAMHQLYRERETSFKEMKELTGKPETTDEEISAKLETLRVQDEKRSQLKREVFDKTSEGMSTRQKAKLYITLQEFEWQMRRLIARAKGMSDAELKELRADIEEGKKDPGQRLLKPRGDSYSPKPIPDKPAPE